MTVLAGIRRIHMRQVLAGRVDPVVATEATARDIAMVEDSRNPGTGLVTVVAPITGDDMVGRLARRLDTVVAGNATAGYGSMIHVSDWAP